MRLIVTALTALLTLPACAQNPAEWRRAAPNVPSFSPAFAGQTRAPEAASGVRLQATPIVSGLHQPWALAFLPDGRMLITEKSPPAMRLLGQDGTLSPPLPGLPPADDRDQGGLLDVAISPRFSEDGLVYWSYAERRPGGNGTTVARGRLVDGPRIEGAAVIFRQEPTLDSTLHFGSRLVFARDGTLFITLGERSILEGRRQAQDLRSGLGKLMRINPDGSIPADNPFVGRADALPAIWSYGHRNVQGAALDLQGQLWIAEMGPRGGDELNRIERGRDYGWPTISYGEEYSGRLLPGGLTQAPGMEQPVYYWDPVIAPSGMVFYTGSLFPAWRGSVLIGGLAGKALVRLALADGRVVGEERFLTDRGARIRDVRQGPDGAVYVLTDSRNGQLLRLTPAP